jgi:rod shape-determining protein MreD
VQTTLLPHVSVAGIRPDLCLVAVCLVGFVAGEVEGGWFGLAIGFVQDLFSASDVWLNMLIKGLIGAAAGLIGRHLAHPTPTAILSTLGALSFVSGAVALLWAQAPQTWDDVFVSLRLVLVPQTIYDTVMGALGYWLLAGRTLRQSLETDIG